MEMNELRAKECSQATSLTEEKNISKKKK